MNAEIALTYPLFALVLLKAVVWFLQGQLRIASVRSGVVDVDAFRLEPDDELPESIVRSGRNYLNLFELPTLFYVAVLLILFFNMADQSFVVLAWSYVLLRTVHSIIHLTYNNVRHRFFAFLLSCVVLWLIWGRLFWFVLNVA